MLFSISLCLTLFIAASGTSPAEVERNHNFRVDFTKVSNELRSPRPLGFSADHVLCGDLSVAAARSVNAGVLRYPEGERGDLYLWNAEAPDHPKLSVGGADKSWTTGTKATGDSNKMLSFDRFLNICEQADAVPLVILGIDAVIYTGNEPHANKAEVLQAAKDWVAYARSKGYDGVGPHRIYWEIGNESYDKSITGAPAWKPAEYAAFFNEMVAGLKTVDPRVQCGANGVWWSKWWETVIPTVENQAAFYITHVYSKQTNQAAWSADEKPYETLIPPLLHQLELHPNAARRIFFSELSSYHPNFPNNDATWRVLHNLEVFSECLAQPYAEYAVFWTAFWGEKNPDTSTKSLFFPNYTLTQQGEGFQLLGRNLESIQQPWQSDGPVRCYSSCNAARTRAVVLLINKSLTPQKCSVNPSGLQRIGRMASLSRLSLTLPEHGKLKCEENIEELNVEPDKDVQLILQPLSATWLRWK